MHGKKEKIVDHLFVHVNIANANTTKANDHQKNIYFCIPIRVSPSYSYGKEFCFFSILYLEGANYFVQYQFVFKHCFWTNTSEQQ